MKITSLEQLLEDELKDIYSAENQLLKALPNMASAAESRDLRASFEKHLEQTQTHVQQIFEAKELGRAGPDLGAVFAQP